MDYDLTSFKEGLRELNIELSELQFKQFIQYYEMLVEKNKVMNLTAITDWEEVVTKHFLDSLSLIKVVKDMTNVSYSLLDLGTGAGFPGIPLKIAFPSLRVTLIDSLNKRVLFLNDVIASLGLTDINAFHGRAEDFAHNKDYREAFDIVVSRAVTNMTVLSEFCIPYVKTDGFFIPYKSEKVKDELKESMGAIRLLGGEVSSECEFTLPGSSLYRDLIMIKKIKSTPDKYPRKAGLPSKEPLYLN